MFATQYYCLVASLKEYALDADTKGFDARAIVSGILEEVNRGDAREVRLLYGYYDCENIAALRAGRSAHNPLGNFTREELEEEVKTPRRLPAPVARVLRAFADPEGEDAEEVARLIGEQVPALKGKIGIYNIGTVIGAHTGPGTVALFFMGDKRVD